MLCHKHGVATHGCLLPIIGNFRRCQALGNKAFCMIKYCGQTLLLQIVKIFAIQAKARAEFGPFQRLEQLIDLSHAIQHPT